MSDFPTTAPTLTDGRVTLRAHRPEDLTGIVEQCNDESMKRFTTVPRPYGEEQARWFTDFMAQHWANGERGATRGWAIEVDNGERPCFAGSIDYRKDLEWPVAEVGYGLHPWVRGRGVGEAALRLVLDFAFERDRLETMHWRAIRGNWGSRKIAWKCGFTIEGTVRDLHTGPAGIDDCWIGSLRRDEPRHPRTPWHSPGEMRAGDVLLRSATMDDPGADEFLASSWDRMSNGELIEWALVAPGASGQAAGYLRLEGMTPAGPGAGCARLTRQQVTDVAPEVMQIALALILDRARRPVAEGGLGLTRVIDVDAAPNLLS